MLKYLPMPQSQIDNGSTNYNATAQINDYFQQEYAGKIEHKFTDKVSLTGFYLYNRTNEPCSNYYYIGLNDPNRFADPGDYILARRPGTRRRRLRTGGWRKRGWRRGGARRARSRKRSRRSRRARLIRSRWRC